MFTPALSSQITESCYCSHVQTMLGGHCVEVEETELCLWLSITSNSKAGHVLFRVCLTHGTNGGNLTVRRFGGVLSELLSVLSFFLLRAPQEHLKPAARRLWLALWEQACFLFAIFFHTPLVSSGQVIQPRERFSNPFFPARLSVWQILRWLSIIQAEREWLRTEQNNGKTYKVRFITSRIFLRGAPVQCHEP